MVNKTSRIIGIIVLILGFLVLSLGTKAQKVMQRGNTFIQIVDSSKTVKEPIKTGYTYMDAKGIEYPIYLSANGKAYVLRTSKRTGKTYRQYLPEVTKRIESAKK